METITHIKRVEINKLWNKQDIEWHLNKDVNILAGINGSGKTTILELIGGTMMGEIPKETGKMAESVKVIFNNDKYITYKKVKGTVKNLILKAKKDTLINEYITHLKEREGRGFNKIYSIEGTMISYQNVKMTKEELHKTLGVDVISTFDHELKEYDALKKLTDEAVKTELDLQIYLLQKQYLEYQINIGKKAIEALNTPTTDKNLQRKIAYKKNLFLDTIDEMLKPTNKCIDRDKNELVFKADQEELSPYMLSSGEKQLVIILLTALIQEDRPYVLFLDEPEISLHTDWQEKLIDNIRKLNNNVQIIIATHSPSIVLDGWKSKVFEVSEITKTKK